MHVTPTQHAGVSQAIADGRIPVMMYAHEQSGVPVTEPFEFWGLWVCGWRVRMLGDHGIPHHQHHPHPPSFRISGYCIRMLPWHCGAPTPTYYSPT